MNLIDEVISIETPAIRNLNWYYHSFDYSRLNFIDMLTNGLKCRKLLNLKGSGNNGSHYISLLKDHLNDNDLYGFDSFMTVRTSFIIDESLQTFKCSDKFFLYYFAKTLLPLRHSGFKDEYQAFKEILPSFFIGLQIPLYNWVTGDYYWAREYYTMLKEIILIMQELNLSLPLYDYSRREKEKVHVIDSTAYLNIHDTLISSTKKYTPREAHVKFL